MHATQGHHDMEQRDGGAQFADDGRCGGLAEGATRGSQLDCGPIVVSAVGGVDVGEDWECGVWSAVVWSCVPVAGFDVGGRGCGGRRRR